MRQPLTPPPGGRALSPQSCTQEIGEELVNGVIHSISLRKVQAHHGANKGQRWLGVSVGTGAPTARTLRRPGGQTPLGDSVGFPPRAFLPEGPTAPPPRGSWAFVPPPPPHCPVLGSAGSIPLHVFDEYEKRRSLVKHLYLKKYF